MKKSLCAALGLICLHGCADRERSDAPREAPASAANQEERVPLSGSGPMSAGVWQSAGAGRSAELLFVTPNSVNFALSCHGGRGMVAELRGLTPSGPVNMMRFSVGGQTRSFAVDPVSGVTPVLRAILPADVDVTVHLRSEPAIITVDVGDGAALRLPASGLVVALARNCSQL